MLIEVLIEYRRRGGWNPRPSRRRVPTSIADLGGAEHTAPRTPWLGASTKLLLSVLLVAEMLQFATCTSYAAPPQYAFADVRGGRLRGRVNATTGVRSFLGVRYAQPPLNDLRWREPLPERNWTGVRDALNFGDVCLQNPLFGWNSIENRGNMSEDCLYLNVVAPPPRAKPYPVMVYIHAGEFHFGSGADRESDEPHFADDVVLVSFNYRLGVFGFLASDDLRDRTAYGGTGNYGVHDQRAALQWVQHNIGAFGGDASNVILWGESSGGTSVALHLVSPRSHRLFPRRYWSRRASPR